jgi:hypothetical protein
MPSESAFSRLVPNGRCFWRGECSSVLALDLCSRFVLFGKVFDYWLRLGSEKLRDLSFAGFSSVLSMDQSYSANGLLCNSNHHVANLRLISRGTSEIEGKWSYLSLIVMQYTFPGILLLVYPFFPESAYYLIKKGKKEAARKALFRVHGSSDQDMIDIEMKRIESNVRTSEELKKQAALNGPAFYQCFRGTNLVRIPSALPNY